MEEPEMLPRSHSTRISDSSVLSIPYVGYDLGCLPAESNRVACYRPQWEIAGH